MDNQSSGVATQTSQNIQNIITLEELKQLMEKAVKLGSQHFIAYMKKGGLL